MSGALEWCLTALVVLGGVWAVWAEAKDMKKARRAVAAHNALATFKKEEGAGEDG